MTITRPPFRPFALMTLADLRQELAQWDWLLEATSDWGSTGDIVRAHRDECAAWLARREREQKIAAAA